MGMDHLADRRLATVAAGARDVNAAAQEPHIDLGQSRRQKKA
jgi:hypothetical protein